jgi:hypothetical protein
MPVRCKSYTTATALSTFDELMCSANALSEQHFTGQIYDQETKTTTSTHDTIPAIRADSLAPTTARIRTRATRRAGISIATC